MELELMSYLPEIISVCVIAVFMSISPGADFVMVTRNCLFHERKAGLYSALGISLAIWVHVAYSIAGVAVIISNSVVLFSMIKYVGAAYLI
jgi:threonine/homoserine/homoserine lactone efflux protein